MEKNEKNEVDGDGDDVEEEEAADDEEEEEEEEESVSLHASSAIMDWVPPNVHIT